MADSPEILDVLERRIVVLEKLLIPRNHIKSKDEETIIEKLTQTHSMVSTALVQRETVINILHRLPELDRLMDPSDANDYDIKAMYQMLITLFPILKVMAVDARDFIQLRRYEDAKNLNQMCELQSKLGKVFANNLELYNDCNKITQNIIICLQDNFNIINSLSGVFAQLDGLVSTIEKLKNKRTEEVNEE